MKAALPTGYEVIEVGGEPPSTVVVLPRLRDRVLAAGFAEPERAVQNMAVELRTAGGRFPHPVVRVGEDLWVVKSYRRGGLLARWNRSCYFGVGRFLRELEVCSLAERSGIPTVAPVALILRRGPLRCSRAWLITPFIADSHPLSGFFPARRQSLPPRLSNGSLSRAFKTAGETIRRMHGAGIDHCDLNLNNLLVQQAGAADALRVLVLDWDRARVRATAGSFPWRNLLRLYRSSLKLEGDLPLLSSPLRSFLHGYFQGDLGGVEKLRRYYRRWGFPSILFHRLLWK